MNKIFFYGLFMDRSLLTGKGLAPQMVGPAVLPDYRIHIGRRATLLPAPGKRAYGVVMALSDDEARELYAEESVRAYVPEQVTVELLDSGETLDVDCYNLPRTEDLAGTNPEYAMKLASLIERLGLDEAYVEEVASFAKAD